MRAYPSLADDDFVPGRWWRVMREGRLWCETSDEAEARRKMEPGDVLQRLYTFYTDEWRDAE